MYKCELLQFRQACIRVFIMQQIRLISLDVLQNFQ
jgi:hypothetical protein